MNYEDLKVGMKVKLVKMYPDRDNKAFVNKRLVIGNIYTIEHTGQEGYHFPVSLVGCGYSVAASMIEPVDVFLNESHTPFKDLTDEQKLLIIREKMKGNVEGYSEYEEKWYDDECLDEILFDNIYRTKPVAEAPKETPLDLPWQFIKPEYKWAAMDKNKEIYLFEAEPHTEGYYWNEVTSQYYCLSDLMNIPTEGVVWNLSLTKRPD